MFVHQFLTSLFARASLAILIVAVTGCGGGGGGSTIDPPVADIPPPAQKATVTVLFTDAPSDEFDQIFVTITSVQLLGSGDRQTLFDGEETVDLLQLENFSDLFVVADDVDAGTYDKIRLHVSDLELVRLDGDGNVIESIHPRLPANGKIDLNPRGSFSIAAGDSVLLQLDMDARRSIHIVGTGNGGYRFRPVVFVDVLVDQLDGKNVRINGEITAVDETGQTIVVCQQHPSSSSASGTDDDDAPRHCVTVAVVDGTGIFDSDGLGAAFSALQVGESVTVIGRFALDDDGFDDPNTLIADVIMLGTPGTFEQLEGTALTAVAADNRFDFLIAPGQGFAGDSTISVELQPATGLVDDDGDETGVEQIQPDVDALIEGVIVLSSDSSDTLRAAYVVLDLDTDGVIDDDEIMLSGEILTVDIDASSLNLATPDGDRCIDVDDQTGIFEITSDGDASLTDSIELAALSSGSLADVYGMEGVDGCLDAAVIIVAAGD